jgi:hypothetical protein
MNAAGTAFGFISSLYTGAGPEALQEAEEHAWELAGRIYARTNGLSEPTENGKASHEAEILAQLQALTEQKQQPVGKGIPW